jgi:hypothetical protein
VNGWVNGWVTEWVSGWVSGKINEWVHNNGESQYMGANEAITAEWAEWV